MSCRWKSGLPDFSWSKHTQTGKYVYQKTTKLSNGRRKFQMVITHTHIFNSKALQNIPKVGFLVWKNIPSGNPVENDVPQRSSNKRQNIFKQNIVALKIVRRKNIEQQIAIKRLSLMTDCRTKCRPTNKRFSIEISSNERLSFYDIHLWMIVSQFCHMCNRSYKVDEFSVDENSSRR
jgi:hypothetical protein